MAILIWYVIVMLLQTQLVVLLSRVMCSLVFPDAPFGPQVIFGNLMIGKSVVRVCVIQRFLLVMSGGCYEDKRLNSALSHD